MIELREWIRGLDLPGKPWLLLGKGPTLEKLGTIDTSRYNVIGLNHVGRDHAVDVGHVIDASVIDDCGHALLRNCRFLVMPRHPHVNCSATSTPLEDFVEESPVLRRFEEEGRLVWYNLSTSRPVGDSPVVEATFFSAEAALRILGTMGVDTVRTLGVDGGRGYSHRFADLERRTMFANGRQSFDEQTAELDRIAEEHGIDLAPLHEPMRVFVGTDESQTVATRVLEHSIRRHASEPVTIHPMANLNVPRPRKAANRPRTGFSFARFLIPQLCGYRGRALYVDADMQVFSDLAELWEIPFGDQTVLCTNQPDAPDAWANHRSFFEPGRQMSVMLLDCSRLDWRIEEIVGGLDEERYDYRDLMFNMCIVDAAAIEDRIPPEWNCLEWHEPGRSKLTHYTVVPTQPWKNDENPLRFVWERGYREAVEAGAVSAVDVVRGIRAGHLKEGLLESFPRGDVERAERVVSDVNAPAVLPPHGLHRWIRAARIAMGNPVGAVRRVLRGTWN